MNVIETMKEMRRVTKRGGSVVLFEHNPWNPAIQVMVRCCPVDRNAHLVSLGRARKLFAGAELEVAEDGFILLFPSILSGLRPFESRFSRLPLGAQYFIEGRKVDVN